MSSRIAMFLLKSISNAEMIVLRAVARDSDSNLLLNLINRNVGLGGGLPSADLGGNRY